MATRRDMLRRCICPCLANVELAIMVRVAKQRNFAVGRNVESLGRPGHPDGHADGWLVPKQFILILQPVAIGVAQQMDPPVVAESGEPSVGREAEVVDIREPDRKFVDSETRNEHVHDRLGSANGHRKRKRENRKVETTAKKHQLRRATFQAHTRVRPTYSAKEREGQKIIAELLRLLCTFNAARKELRYGANALQIRSECNLTL